MKVSTPKRVSHTYTQSLTAPPERVFPLLCPVREADWIDGWDPVSVVSASGVAERDCVFVTSEAAGQAIWCITRHQPRIGFVEMLKVTPGVTVCRLAIQLFADPSGSRAEITYVHTSLGPEGDRFVESFTAQAYEAFMRDWETRMNYYLQHGSALRSSAG